MSNDLIKRQNAIENIWSIFNNTYNDASRFETEETELARKVLADAQRIIESQPTAYDVDKVVEQLEELRGNELDGIRKGISDIELMQSIRGQNILNDVIEIVKSGGINKAKEESE